MSKDQWLPFKAVLATALERLINDLKDAQEYLDSDHHGAAIGTLVSLDNTYADLQAALRLFKSQRTL
jgi:hypothetical protein